MSRRNTRPRGQLKVTAPTSFTRLHLAPFLSRFVEQFPEIQLDFHLTDSFVDIIRDGYDVAIQNRRAAGSSLAARKLCADRRILCAAPSYLERAGEPRTPADLEHRNCLSASAQDVWRLEGPEGSVRDRISRAIVRSDSADLLRAALVAGIGLGFRSIWEIEPELASGALKPDAGRLSRLGAARHLCGLSSRTSCRQRFTPSSSSWREAQAARDWTQEILGGGS